MEKYFLDPTTLLGRVVTSKPNYEIVHLSLKAGNEVPEYRNKASIIIFVIEGEILLSADEEIFIKERELVELPGDMEHKMIAIKDSQIMAIKV